MSTVGWLLVISYVGVQCNEFVSSQHHVETTPASSSFLPPQCQRRARWRQAMPNDCSKYIRCMDGETYINSCDFGMLFDDTSKSCKLTSNVQCLRQNQQPTPLDYDHTNRQSASINIDTFVVENAVHQLEVQAIDAIHCRKIGKLEAHLTDCDKFIDCVHGTGIVQQCGPGTVFNEAIRACDWPYNVDCSRSTKLSALLLNSVGNNPADNIKSNGVFEGNIGQRYLSDGFELTQTKEADKTTNASEELNAQHNAQTNHWDTQLTNSQRYVIHKRRMTTPIPVPLPDNSPSNGASDSFVQPTSRSSMFDQQLVNSERYNQHMRRTTTRAPDAVPSQTMSAFDREYSSSLEQRIRKYHAPGLSSSSTQTPINDDATNWGYHTITQSQRQPHSLETSSFVSQSDQIEHSVYTNDQQERDMEVNPYQSFKVVTPETTQRVDAVELEASLQLIDSYVRTITHRPQNESTYQGNTTIPSDSNDLELTTETSKSQFTTCTTENSGTQTGLKWMQSPTKKDVELLTQDVLAECEFDCKSDGHCVAHSKVCNGLDDCGNYHDEQHCPSDNYQIRLAANTSTPYKGLLEIHLHSLWAPVCDTDFGMTEANVACRELGYSLGAVQLLPTFVSDNRQNTSARFHMDAVQCRGNETSIRQCGHLGWGVHNNCTLGQAIGVVCNDPSAALQQCPTTHWQCETSGECVALTYLCDGVRDCADSSDENDVRCELALEFRLSARLTMGDTFEGRMEVRNKGVWGTICDDGLGEREAEVFCRSIGYNGTAEIIVKNESNRNASGPLWMDQVRCQGSELSLDQCVHNFGNHNCYHSEDAVIKCSIDSSQTTKNFFSNKHSKTNPNTKNLLINPPTISLPEQCGQIQVQRNATDVNAREGPVYRILNGDWATRGHHPWQASIRLRRLNLVSEHECGATVISSRHVITAAHCVTNYRIQAYIVRVGDHLTDVDEVHERQVFVKRLHIHPQFHSGTISISDNDIAIVELKQTLDFNEMVQPICLPPVGAVYSEGLVCTISGWGSSHMGSMVAAKQLRSAQVPIIADDVCKQEKVYGTSVKDNMFCAGFLEGNSTDACRGDSGGPLVCETDDIHRLYGIISWGIRCGEPNRPGVYVKVTKYIEWIMDVIQTA